MMSVKLLVVLLVALCGSSASAFVKRSPFQYEYKNKLYYFETYYKATFYTAFMSCSKLGMNLLSIDSDEEFDKIHMFVKDKMEYKNDLMIWTSAAAKGPKQFYWMNTGDPVRLSRWHPGEPNNSGEKEYCLHIWFINGKFLLNDTRCLLESYFICESKKV